MAAEALIFEQLLEIVRHSNQVQLDESVAHVDPRRVHIPEYLPLLVHVVDAFRKLSENGNDLVESELSLAERFPRRDVIWTFAAYLEEAAGHVTIEIPDRSRQIEQVWVIQPV